MQLPSNFLFSQGNLQDFYECRRRFQLRYIEKLAWPAIKCEPVLEYEQAMFKGQKFHRLVNGYFLGIRVDLLTDMAGVSGILGWWMHFLNFITGNPYIQGAANESEATYLVEIGNHRLIARYDLIVKRQESIIIFDWKTSQGRPKRSQLEKRLQTRIYPYLLAERAPSVFDLNQLSMVYWFSEFPNRQEIFTYSIHHLQQDKTYLLDLVTEIEGLGSDEYYLTAHEDQCRYCVYRSLCNRGIEAGEFLNGQADLDENANETFNIQFDFQDIQEIEF